MVEFHTVCAITALLLGPISFWRPKGDRLHRALGFAFLTAMLGVDLSGFGIYRFTGGPSVFHALALLNLATLLDGLLAARHGQVARHLASMIYAYTALIAALGSRLPQLLPDWPVSLAIGLGVTLPFAVAALVVRIVTRRLGYGPSPGDSSSSSASIS